MVGFFVNLLRIPYCYLVPTVMVACICGVYGASFKAVDIVLMALFGVVGYVLRKFEFDLAILVMGVVLGDRIEMSFRRAMSISEGDLAIFFKSGFSKLFIIAAGGVVLLQLGSWLLGLRARQTGER
jgi:putative tricarboxylic transport membrane protein